MPLEDKHVEVDLRLYKELARFGYTPLTLRQSFNSLQTIHEFLQFMGTNQYYSESVNKKIFLLGLDADYAVICTEELMLKEKNFVEEVQRALVLKRKPKIDERKMDEFKKQVEEVEKQVLDLSAKAKELIRQIRTEFQDREFDFKHH
ncbi:MAG: hypothetical protein QXR53_03245 [Candidatus Norongarragalinales archaeon]